MHWIVDNPHSWGISFGFALCLCLSLSVSVSLPLSLCLSLSLSLRLSLSLSLSLSLPLSPSPSLPPSAHTQDMRLVSIHVPRAANAIGLCSQHNDRKPLDDGPGTRDNGPVQLWRKNWKERWDFRNKWSATWAAFVFRGDVAWLNPLAPPQLLVHALHLRYGTDEIRRIAPGCHSMQSAVVVIKRLPISAVDRADNGLASIVTV